ncbi:uncharacterized protein LOC134261560 [Saccostrea cucullata]|uniref:uncharacterized protein LOC134261560 n=1 Tax=Saccostrea cuccullata TaxID=36930 RepID=UPI002ED02052
MKSEIGKTGILIVLIVLCSVGFSRAGQKCMYCNRAANVSDCSTNIIECSDAEECYLEKITTQELKTAYVAGCRSQSVCALMQSLGSGRKRSDYTNCVECCNSAPTTEHGPCNANLCGEKGVSKSGCLVCDDLVRTKGGCTNRQVCQDTQVCGTAIHIVGGDVLYRYFCEERHICAAALQNNVDGHIIGAVNKRVNSAENQGLVVCSACCFGNDCNQEGCLELKKKNITVDMLGTSPTVLPTAG